MIYYIGKPVPDVPVSSWKAFVAWADEQNEYQHDIETNVTEYWCDKKIITVQFGDINDTEQWVLQWSQLNDAQKQYIKELLEGRKNKLIHNALFECVVWLFHGVRVQNVYDTMLIEMVLNCGLLNYGNDEDEEMDNPEEASFYSLSGTCARYLGYYMIKSEYQLSFGDDIMSAGKIKYAAGDVRPLGFIRRLQIPELQLQDAEYTAALENESVLGFAQMTYNGVGMDVEKWRDNIALAVPVVEQARKSLAESVIEDDKLRNFCIREGWLSAEDRLVLNWNSAPKKAKIFRHFFPELPGGTKAVLTKWLRDGLGTEVELECIKPMMKDEPDYSVIEKYIMAEDRQWLIENDMLIPKGELTINWNSSQQKLKLLQQINPKLESTDKKALEKVNHVMKEYLINYGKRQKLLSTYGEKFLLNIEPDGKIRPVYKQIVSTGRVSSRPNIQNIPILDKAEDIGDPDPLRYRNAFICEPWEKFVGSDYMSQELVFMASISREPAWIEALQQGKDLHSVCAELMYKAKWKNGAEPDCLYYKTGQKCKCKQHKFLRVPIKSVNFGLPYGMSHFKLAADMRIPVPEAKALIDEYFRTFPRIHKMLVALGTFGVTNGYIKTLAPFWRRRWFPFWKYGKDKIHHFLAGIVHDSNLGSIERQSKNMPIQGSAADCTKVALCLLYWHIFDNGLDDKVKIRIQVHDAIDTTANAEYAEEWAPQLTRIMEEAAMYLIPNGLLRAETTISDVWSK